MLRYLGLFQCFCMVLFLNGLTAYGQERASYCYSQRPENGYSIQGQNLDEPVVIASLTKIFLSYWALRVWGPEMQFQTKFHIVKSPNDKATWLHIQGSGDPFFGSDSFLIALAEMRSRGYHKIQNVTFNSEFSFAKNPISLPHSYIAPGPPNPKNTESELSSFLSSSKSTYQIVRQWIQKTFASDPPLALARLLSPVKMAAEPPPVFAQQSQAITTLLLESAPLYAILKEMNRTSNNRAAEILFHKLGGARAMERFFLEEFGAPMTSLKIWNGSGLPSRRTGPRSYNLATCRSLLLVLSALDKLLESSSLNGIEDILSVASEEKPGAKLSVVSRFYRNHSTEETLVAKTGTVDPAVALSGGISTEPYGMVYFGIVYHLKSKDRTLPAAAGRREIKMDLRRLYESLGQSRLLKPNLDDFVPIHSFRWF